MPAPDVVEALAVPAAAGEPLVLRLREARAICGFRFTPGDGKKMPLISEYSLQISEDNATWQTVHALDRFDNIENDPTARTRHFPAVRAQYVKLTPHASVNGAYDMRPTQVDLFIQ